MSETEFAENEESAGGDEPTMEEILSSIRRIISDDDAVEEPAEEVVEDVTDEFDNIEADEDEDDEILELTEILAEEDPVDEMDDMLLSPDDIDDLEFSTPDDEMEMAVEVEDISEPVEAMPEPVVQAAPELAISDSLISEQVGAQVNDTFNILANTMLAQNGAGQTVESMVMALMRPMLKSWLDENLPVMVEKIVREEIERVARGGKV